MITYYYSKYYYSDLASMPAQAMFSCCLSSTMITFLAIILVITITYYLVKQNYRYWEKRGVKGPKPTFLVGNLGKCFLFKAQPGEIYNEAYKEYNRASVVGLYRSLTPILLLRDPDLIKEATIKSFHNFRDNDMDVDVKADPLFGRHPFVLKGDEWKMVRAQLSPGFTSGKMRWIYSYMEDNSRKMVSFIDKEPATTNGTGYDAKELCVRYTINNVADSVFGIDAKCFEQDNSEFRQLAREFISPESWAMLIMFAATVLPSIVKVFPVRFCARSVEKKLLEIVSQTLQHREQNNVVRNDFLHILSELKKTCTDYEFTDVDVTAHAAGFFGDGYETSSIVMSSALFLLASNPESQSKLREEVNKTFDENNNQLPYETLQALPYLDAVVNETLRLMPAAYALQKICTESWTYTPKETNKSFVIEKGTPIVLPVYALQTDPEYFEDADKFVPERFIGKNREKIRKCTFLPFGEGPRACMGQRFGTLQLKVGISYIVRNYELFVNKKTQLPLKFDPTNILITPIGGLWIDFKRIS